MNKILIKLQNNNLKKMSKTEFDREFERKHIGRTLECYKRTFSKKIEAKVNRYLSKLRVTILLTTNRLEDEELVNFSKNLEDYMFEFEDDFDSHLNSHVQLVRNRLNVGHIDVSFGGRRNEDWDHESRFDEISAKSHFEETECNNLFDDEEQIFEERVFIQPQSKCNGLFQTSDIPNERGERDDFKTNIPKKTRKIKVKKVIRPKKKNRKNSSKWDGFMKKTVFLDERPVGFWEEKKARSKNTDYPQQEEPNNIDQNPFQNNYFQNGTSEEEYETPFVKPKKLGKRNQRINFYENEIEVEKSRPKKSIKLGEVVNVNTADLKPMKVQKQSFGSTLNKNSQSFSPSEGNIFERRISPSEPVENKMKFNNKVTKIEKGKVADNKGKSDKPSVTEPVLFKKIDNLGNLKYFSSFFLSSFRMSTR